MRTREDLSQSPALAWQPRENREIIQTELDGTWQVAADDPDYAAIRRQLVRLERAQAGGDPEKMTELVDWPRYNERYFAAYRFQPINGLNKLRLKQIARDDFSMPGEAHDFRIAADTRLGEHDWIIYTYAQQGSLADISYIFQFHRDDDQWKLVDWCETMELRWQSEFSGMGAGPLVDDAEGDRQRQFVELLLESDEFQAEYDFPQAQATLRRAETVGGMYRLHDSNLNLLALRWHNMGEAEEALRLYQLAEDPDRVPWLHYTASMSYYSQEDYQHALEAAVKCRQNGGLHLEAELTKARSLQELGRTEEAAEVAVALLNYQADNGEAISLALQNMPPHRLGELIEALGGGDEALSRIIEHASSLLYDDDVAAYEACRSLVAGHTPESPKLLELDADLLHYQGDLVAALAKYREYLARLSAPTDQEAREVALSSWISIAMKLHSTQGLYEQTAWKQEILELLTDGINYEEAWIGLDELAEMLPLHLRAEPDDPRNAYYTALVAADQKQLDEAAQAYRAAIAHLQDHPDEDDPNLVDSLEYGLLNVRYQKGEALAAYRESADRDAAFRSLAELMEYASDWPALEELLELYSPTDESAKLRTRYYRLRIEQHRAVAANDTPRISRTIRDLQQLQRDNEEVGELYEFQLTSQINALVVESPDYMDYLWHQEEAPEAVFRSLVRHFEETRQAEDLAQVVRFFRKEFPDSEALFEYELEQLWRDGDYAGYINKVGPWPAERIVAQGYRGQEIRERLTLCHLLLKDRIDAWVVALQPEPDRDLQILVKMATNDESAVDELLAEDAENSYFMVPPAHAWLAVSDITSFLRGSDFRQIRSELPLPPGGLSTGTHAMLLYPQVKGDHASLLDPLLEAGFEDLQLQHLDLDSNSYRLITAEGECLVTIGSGPLMPPEEIDDYVWSDEESFIQAAQSHQGWLALELPLGSTAAMQDAWHRLLMILVGDASVVWISPEETSSLTLIDPQQIARLRQGDPLSALRDSSVSAYLPFGNQGEFMYHPSGDRRWRAKMQQAATEAAGGRIQIALNQGSVVEKVWLKLREVKHQNWGTYVIHAEMEQNSKLNPYLFAGDLMRVQPYTILQWED
jgi:tetratricopeptide (TPR) repeat protein